MKEIVGKYNSAKIFTDVVDEKSLDQVKLLCDQEFVKGSKIRMMPDIHAGAGCTIGTTMTITDRICPNLVGVDIGCGMYVSKLRGVTESDVDLEKLDIAIRNAVPSGFNIRQEAHPYHTYTHINELYCKDDVDIERAKRSIGTLGGGNHFIELDKDDDGNLYLVIHSGSRHLGKEVAEYYQKWAVDSMKSGLKNQREWLIDDLKRQGREKDISKELSTLQCDVPDALCSFGGKLFYRYIHDMNIVQDYAMWNRFTIATAIKCSMNWHFISEDFHTIHNYIDTGSMILRKGAVSAKEGEKLLIPINMRDGSLICVGKGNPDWNYSAPHGAGRLFGRMEAKRRFSVDEFKDSMDGIYTTSVGQDTLDECPMAYKSMDDIVNNIGDTVDILNIIKPIYNFKASE